MQTKTFYVLNVNVNFLLNVLFLTYVEYFYKKIIMYPHVHHTQRYNFISPLYPYKKYILCDSMPSVPSERSQGKFVKCELN